MKNWQQSLLIFTLLFAGGLILPRLLRPTQKTNPIASTQILEDEKKEDQKEELEEIPKPKEEKSKVLSAQNIAQVQEGKVETPAKNINQEVSEDVKPEKFHRVFLSNSPKEGQTKSNFKEQLSFQAIVFGTQEVEDGDQLMMLAEEDISVGEGQLKRNQVIYPKVSISGDTLLLTIRLEETEFSGYNREEKNIILPVKSEGKFKKILRNNKDQQLGSSMKISDKYLVTFKIQTTNE
ncbi:MAG: conjugative transposon protein TraM [Flammeovirgaceae bacterium]|nr:conjugative transposon protein TraM [Flammeovirgaceae bacterium]